MKFIKHLLFTILISLILLVACSPTASEEAEPSFAPESQEQLTPVKQPDALEKATAVAPPATPENEDNVPAQDPVTSFNETREASGSDDVRQDPEEMIPTSDINDNGSFASDENVTNAKKDLSEKLGVPVEDIEVIKYEEVMWRDGSLGCPSPKVSYIQVVQEGYRFQLIVADKVYDYHGVLGQHPFYCDETLNKPEIPPLPGSAND